MNNDLDNIYKKVLLVNETVEKGLLLRYDTNFEVAPRLIGHIYDRKDSIFQIVTLPKRFLKKLDEDHNLGQIIAPKYYQTLARAFKRDDDSTFPGSESLGELINQHSIESLTIFEFRDGFRIEAPGFESLLVKTDGISIHIESRKLGFYEITRLLFIIKYWFCVPVKRPLMESIIFQRDRLMKQASESVIEAQKVLFNHISCCPEVAKHNRFYSNTKLLAKLNNHRACAIALRYCQVLIQQFYCNLKNIELSNDNSNFSYSINYSKSISTKDCLVFLENHDWRVLFSHDGKRYSALDITLDSMPREASPIALLSLPFLRLDQAIIEPYGFELLEVIHEFHENKHTQIMANASKTVLNRSLKYASRFKQIDLHLDRASFRLLLSLIAEYPGRPAKDLFSLVQKCIAWSSSKPDT